MREPTFGIRRINSGGKHVNRLAKEPLALAQSVFHYLAITDVTDEATRMSELTVFKQRIRIDEHVAN